MKQLNADKKGAVLVEFLVALMPLMITFSSFVQLAQSATAKLVVKHSAVVGARAAAVISNKNNNTPDQPKGANQADIEAGVKAALGPWLPHMDSVQVQVEDSSSCDDPYGLVKVTVTVEHKCEVPFGGRLVCGAGATHTFKQAYSFPHQGARYKDGGGADCDKGGSAGGGTGGGGFSGGGGSFGGGGASGTF